MVSITAQKPVFSEAGALRKKVNPFSTVVAGYCKVSSSDSVAPLPFSIIGGGVLYLLNQHFHWSISIRSMHLLVCNTETFMLRK